jgi:hypothetical protein
MGIDFTVGGGWRRSVLSRDQRGKDDFRHDLVHGRSAGVVVAPSKHRDEVVLRHDVDFLAAVALRGVHVYTLVAWRSIDVKPRPPPEVALIGIVHLALR